MNLVFFGRPGTGKSSQASLLAHLFGQQVIVFDDVVARILADQSDMLSERLLSNQLPFDEDLFINVINPFIENRRKGIIFDGFPTMAPQALALDKMLSDRGQRIDHAIELVTEASDIDTIEGSISDFQRVMLDEGIDSVRRHYSANPPAPNCIGIDWQIGELIPEIAEVPPLTLQLSCLANGLAALDSGIWR